MMSEVKLYLGDCLDILPTLEAGSVDAVITDPPYPHIKRDYGYWTEAEWWELIVEGVIPQVRRILKPTGSAVFILQPNSEKVGKMRGWLWEFMAWVCREWNMVQDVYWWNYTAPVCGVCSPRERGLLRASVKICVWAGESDCRRDQDAVLWEESYWNTTHRLRKRWARDKAPSGQGTNKPQQAAVALERGGVTPFNVLPIHNAHMGGSRKSNGHGASTPLELANWWARYIVPPDGVVLDPFFGVGTMGLAALQNGCDCIGTEIDPDYYAIAERRIKEAQEAARQLRLDL